MSKLIKRCYRVSRKDDIIVKKASKRMRVSQSEIIRLLIKYFKLS